MKPARIELRGAHPFIRCRQRRVPLRRAVEAVKRQSTRLQEFCPVGRRAAIDFSEGRAIVERISESRFAIITLLEWWMAPARGTTLVYNVPKPSEKRSGARKHRTLVKEKLPQAQREALEALRQELTPIKQMRAPLCR